MGLLGMLCVGVLLRMCSVVGMVGVVGAVGVGHEWRKVI